MIGQNIQLRNRHRTFGSRFWFWQSDILHKIERERNVVDLMIVALRRQVKIAQWNEETFEESEEQREKNAVVKLIFEVCHFQMDFAQVFVDECHE